MNHSRYKWNIWNKIDWKTVEIQVFKLQKRIYKASQRGDKKAVHKLQRLLTNSYHGKLLAIRRVTQDNQGKKTAGVDGKKVLTGTKRIKLLPLITIKGKAKPLRRVWIPKPDGTQRGLGIPTIKDRATQALVKLAMEPEWAAMKLIKLASPSQLYLWAYNLLVEEATSGDYNTSHTGFQSH
jgi:RNA-directed DNA polymerase